MPIFIPKFPENPAVSWADLGWQRPGLVFPHGDRGCIHPAISGVQKLEFNGLIYSGNDYNAFYPGLYNLYIIVNMDAMKYRRTRGFTHLVDMGMHGLYLVCQAMPSFQNVQHICKDRIIREVISHKFCRMNRLFFGIRTHTRPEFIKHPDRSCVVRLLGMERAKELPLALVLTSPKICGLSHEKCNYI